MKQLRFGFYQKGNWKRMISFPLHRKKKLIEQMAAAMIKVNKQGGGKRNGKYTNESEDNGESSES